MLQVDTTSWYYGYFISYFGIWVTEKLSKVPTSDKVFLIESLLGSIRKLGLSVHRLITAPEEFENGGLTLINASNVFLHTSKGNLKTQQSPVVYFGLCLKKTLSGRSHDYRDVIFSDVSGNNTKTKCRRF